MKHNTTEGRSLNQPEPTPGRPNDPIVPDTEPLDPQPGPKPGPVSPNPDQQPPPSPVREPDYPAPVGDPPPEAPTQIS